MRFLTPPEISEWLHRHGLPEQPYRNHTKEYEPAFCRQFQAPVGQLPINAFVRNFLHILSGASNHLVCMDCWALYQPCELITIGALRAVAGEGRQLIDAPGHLVEEGEDELVVALFGLSVGYGWQSHLYCVEGKTILCNWEGDLFDFYTEDESIDLKMQELVASFGLEGQKSPPAS